MFTALVLFATAPVIAELLPCPDVSPWPTGDADLPRFPAKVVADEYCIFAKRYRQYCRDRAVAEPRESQRAWWCAAAHEAFCCWDVWDDLRLWHEGDRGAATRVWRALGDEAWWTGTMPPPAPVWRMNWTDAKPASSAADTSKRLDSRR